MVDDQRLNPTFTGHLAAASIAACGAGSTGILHLVAAGCCSYHEFAVELFAVAGIEAEIDPVATAPGGPSAVRPFNGCLVSNRAKPLPAWQEGLRATGTAGHCTSHERNGGAKHARQLGAGSSHGGAL